MIRGAQDHQQTEERHAKKGKHGLINRLRELLMGLPHHILMTYLPVPTEELDSHQHSGALPRSRSRIKPAF